MAIRAFRQRKGRQEIVGAPLIFTRFRMASLWIRHFDAPIEYCQGTASAVP
jgi:hypothetical protein